MSIVYGVRLLEVFRVRSIVLFFFDVLPVRVDSHGLTELGFMSPQFLCNFFSFFNNIYEQLTKN